MAKKKEKTPDIYEVWLNLSFLHDCNNNALLDLKLEIDIIKKTQTKIKRHMKKVAEEYERIHGKLPVRHDKNY